MKTNAANDTKSAADAHRRAGPQALSAALVAGRSALLELLAAYRAALGDELRVAFSSELNLPLWELGHIGWFEEYWIGRNSHRMQGLRADHSAMDASRSASCLADADTLYDSSNVAHATRWQLALPDVSETLDYLTNVREGTLAHLRMIEADHNTANDQNLYFFRLALFHEAMHREAWIYMAQTLGIDLGQAFHPREPHRQSARVAGLSIDGGIWKLGSPHEGFAFDNELNAHEVAIASFRIDRAPVTWQRYLPFIDAGGYADKRWWSAEAWAWLQQQAHALPRYLRRQGTVWQRQCFGVWQDLDIAQPAMNLTYYEAQAWCQWAGRRLPTEAEWEMAACIEAAFNWGEVWEWTASPFAPYPGFAPHPYRDYSAPWFDGRPVLRGASFATDPAMRHPRYRNFFTPERNDIFAGFRSCAL